MVQNLHDFLDLTEEQAAAEWRRILARPARSRGKRQERFSPIEVLLCFGLFRVFSPHSYGGANIDRVPAAGQSLAETFQRSTASLLYKMLNLEGTYRNAGKFEVELFLRLSADPTLFVDLYLRIIRAARRVGLGEGQVPDFLNLLETHCAADLIGQDEIGSTELGIALEEEAAKVLALRNRIALTEAQTDRLVEQRVRLGQHRFAGQVLADYGNRCGFCGFSPGSLSGSRLLFASHIKPWRDSNARERLDRRNGIAACPTHDAAFDGGLLTVNGGKRIHRADRLKDLIVSDNRAETFFGENTVGPTLLVPAGAAGPGLKYLKYHQDVIFRRTGSSLGKP